METKSYPLSDSQKGIYYEWEKDRSLTQYNLTFLYEFPATTDPARLKTAFEKALSAHPGMNVRLRMEGDSVVQYTDEGGFAEISVARAGEQEMKEIISGFSKPFNLLGQALYRLAIFLTEKNLYALFDIHHIIFDGSSVGIFNRDLASAYEGKELTRESFTVCDFAELECSRKDAAGYLEEAEYFEKRLSGVTMTRLPSVKKQDAGTGYLQQVSEFLGKDVVDEFCTRLQISPNNLFAGALGICLNRYTREQNIAFCTAHHGRLDERLVNDTGMFVKTLPVVMHVLPEQPVSGFLAAIRADLTELWKKQTFPFPEMVRRFGASLEIAYTFQKGYTEHFEMEGSAVSSTLLRNFRTTDRLIVSVIPSPANYEIRCEYNDSLYDQAEIKVFAAAIRNTVLNMMAGKDKPCGEISILSAHEETSVVALSQGRPLTHDRTLSLVDLFAEQVKKSPDSIAVVFEDRKLTYRQLDQVTGVIARKLRAAGVTREKVVGIMIDRSEYMVIFPLAVLKAGGAYMPLDYTMPSDRLDFMLRDAGAGHILSEGSRVADHLPGFNGIMINREDIETTGTPDETALPGPAPEDMFVLLYTSGTTGNPKGCMLEHRNIVNFCKWYVEDFNVTPNDRSVAYANFAFDAHMMDIYPMIISGASVYIIPSGMRMDLLRMNSYMEENGLTIAFMTTQIGRQFAEDIENHSLRLLSVGGERLIPTKKPPYRFYNAYGPTECTVYATVYEITADYNSAVIGKPLSNCAAYIMDKNLQLLPAGVAGELCIGGEGVGRGYFMRDDLTREKFVDWKGQKLYRSGDLARYNEAGEIEYFARLDNQVKLRGLRIELGEIESAIAGYEGISAAAVAVKEIGGVQHLCGYFTARNKIEPEVIKDYLRQGLTEFMVPTALIQLEKLPLTNNGKVNRALLPVPQVTLEETVAPSTAMEHALFDIIGEMLKTRDFGVSTNLFSLGMTSILAIKLSITIQKQLGVSIQTKDILKLKTIRAITGMAEDSGLAGAEKTEPVFEKRAGYPLTENQLGLYYDWEKNRDAMQYNIAASLSFSGKVDVKKLKNAVIAVVEAHPYLKTTLAITGNEIVQLRRDDLPVEILVENTPATKMDSVLSSFVRPFNLFGDTLYRFAIHQTELQTWLLFDIHHIVFDGTSMTILLNDLKEAFEGGQPAAEDFTAFDRALEEEALTRSEKYAEAEQYFGNLLGSTSMTVFPSHTQARSAGTAKLVKIDIPAGTIMEFCKTNAVTESNFFLAAFCLLLSRYTREERVAVTTVSSGRGDNRLSGLMGMFVKTLPAVVDIGKQRVTDLMRNIQEQMFDTMERDIFPFTKMAEKYGVVPQINFAYQGGIDTELELGGEFARVDFLNLDTVKFPLSAVIFPNAEGYTMTLEFDDSLYHETAVSRFAKTFSGLAGLMSKNGEKTVPEISLVSEAEKREVLELSAGTALEYDHTLTIVDIFRDQAKKFPSKKALVDSTGYLTYEDLDRWSDALAHKLGALGVSADTFVAVMLPRQKEFMVCVLAVLKAGGAYVPMDHEYPNDRLLYMIRNSEARVLITGSRMYADKQKDGDFSVKNVLFADEFDFNAVPVDTTLPVPSTEHLAYMIYTSGSTGKPKGVMIPHKGLTAMLAWYAHETGGNADDRNICYPSFSFDASVVDLFIPIYVGGECHIIDSGMRQNMVELHHYLVDNGITGCVFSTQFGMEVLNQFELPLRYTLLGGEKLLPVRKRKTRIYNGYGPTEFTVCSDFHLVDQDTDLDNIPVGRPVPNSWSYVVDAGMQLLPPGMAGELCLSGVQIAKGYWQREDLTAEKFVDNPFATCADNTKMYRTGDLVRWNDHGKLEFLGRIDTQIKLRGFRIELGEIESAMKKFAGVASAVVDVREIGGNQHLCGYYTVEGDVDPAKLLAHLKAGLTEYMVPTELMKLPSLPMTPNGKVNRKALPMPEIARTVPYVAPTDGLETSVCAIFAYILKLEKVGALDDFFAIGGSSMSAIKAIIQIINLGCNIKYGDLFKLKTPRAVAAFLSEHAAETETNEEEQLEDISNYDYLAINRILEAERPDLWINYHEYPLGNVLLPGATGYLGIHVLRELIEKETGKIYCMVRAKGSLTPERRLKTQLMYYFSDTFEELFGTRIIPVDGDITKTETLRSLKGKEINTVINCAASVKHYAAGDELDRINVDGVENLIGFCRGEGARLVHISTLSTGGLIEKEKLGNGVLIDESKLYFGQIIDTKYVLSKFKAERMVLQAVSEGFDGIIMRVGNLMGRHSDGEFQINFRSNAFINTLKAYKVLKMFPLSQLVERVEISPIDCVATAVVSLTGVPVGFPVHHAYNNYRLNMANVIYAMKQYGFDISLVSDEVFSARFQEVMQDSRRSEYLSGLLHYRVGQNYAEVPDQNNLTTTLLYKNGVRWPLANDDYSVQLIGVLDGMGFFDEN